ncbi:MAG: cytochrome P450 [Alphaproteobacteria bacterium]|nr:cytochrome P450 [Alphaproteobacteria bacterium]MBL7099138.1 cytochrome P450 [Alphaproteobacteria bacterium]
MAILESSQPSIPKAWRWPGIGNTFAMARDPARFFVDCYRRHGPVFRIALMGRTHTVLAGAEAANFMATREGRESLRSREFWQGLVDEFAATRTLPGEDGQMHARLRDVMKRGYSRTALSGRFGELIAITDSAIARDWTPGARVPTVQAMQYMVTEQLGRILTGVAPLEYVRAIRTTIKYILNVLVTRQRPWFYLLSPGYRRAKARMRELGETLVNRQGDAENTGGILVSDIMQAHAAEPELIPRQDLGLTLMGPYIAGLDTVANTTAACLYLVLKHPEVLARIQAETDRYFAEGIGAEEDVFQRLPATHAAIQEAMRLYPIAVAQMRTAARPFTFGGHRIAAGEMLFVATSVPHFLEEHYPEPERFDIDRFSRERAEHLKSGVYSPYGRGPHTCLGKSLAEVQMLLTMARLFHRLDLSLVRRDYVLKTKTAPTPGPAMSFKVRVNGLRNPAA